MSSEKRLAKIYRNSYCNYASSFPINIPKDRIKRCRGNTPSDKLKPEPIDSSHSINVTGPCINNCERDILSALSSILESEKIKTLEYDLKANKTHKNIELPTTINKLRSLRTVNKNLSSLINGSQLHTFDLNVGFSSDVKKNSLDLYNNSECCVRNDFIFKGEKRTHINFSCKNIWSTFLILSKQQLLSVLIITFVLLLRVTNCQSLLLEGPSYAELSDLSYGSSVAGISNSSYKKAHIGTNAEIVDGQLSSTKNTIDADGSTSGLSGSATSPYPDILDNLEHSVSAVIIKVAHDTTSTTKRSISGNQVPGLTTIATPPLTTLRYLKRMPHQQQINLHHRNYELDLERDHALPTSAPNADILKSNSNPIYPNPNSHQSRVRERHHHILKSSPTPSISSILNKNGSSPTIAIPVLPGDMPSHSSPARAFFTPPLPPEYQNPFADKPTLRGTNNEAVLEKTVNYINRRPIPPPSLMPGHERIPLRPPDLINSGGSVVTQLGNNAAVSSTYSFVSDLSSISPLHVQIDVSSVDWERKKTLNTPSRDINGNQTASYQEMTTQIGHIGGISTEEQPTISTHTRKEVLPSIRRILSGSNGNKGEVPEVLLKQVTSRPLFNYHQPPSSPVMLTERTSKENSEEISGGLLATSNINRIKANSGDNNAGAIEDEERKNPFKIKISTKAVDISQYGSNEVVVGFTPSVLPAIGEVAAATSTSASIATYTKTGDETVSSTNNSNSTFSTSSSSRSAAGAAHATWTIAWNIHVYLSVILFTILGVYSLYKILTYNKLTHLFSQSYCFCINLILVIISSSRIFYLCYDAYNIHSTLHIFVSEILLNLPATLLTISFSVLILFLFLKSVNHKNHRYSALIRPLTVFVGCGVHVVLCITLHYVESYTMQNHQQHMYYQHKFYRRQAHQASTSVSNINVPPSTLQHTTTVLPPPPRVLSLICQIIYIFICLSLGLLYLYIYRILKRILHSKSKNYLHGSQNLSYAIHITIATALLFVLLSALQILGAICISITRPLMTRTSVEMDWLQWGYQFSQRLIEIAIITLISWVAGLKTSGSMDAFVGDRRVGVESESDAGIFGPSNSAGTCEKESNHHHSTTHTDVSGFFLPCTSNSSQKHFETDYPAVCNANTNLHTYTMRTGKLIYDDSLALNSLGSAGQSMPNGQGVGNTAFHMQSTYQQPYDTGSIHSSTNYNVEFMSPCNKYHRHSQHTYGDYLTNATTDHYENPNFELRSGKTYATGHTMQNSVAQTSTKSITTSCSGGSASGTSSASQQQMLLMKNDTCYSDPMQQNLIATSDYAFNNFERPKFTKNNELGLGFRQPVSTQVWADQQSQYLKNRENKSCTNFERATYENPERRSSNSTNSCSSGGCDRFSNYNLQLNYNGGGMRKSGTLSNTVDDIEGRNSSSPIQRSGAQTLASAQQQQIKQLNQRSGRNIFGVIGVNHDKEKSEHDFSMGHASLDRTNSHSIHVKQLHKHGHCLQHDFGDDMILAGGNAECTNLISDCDDTWVYNSIAPNNPEIGIISNARPINKPMHFISLNLKKQQQLGNYLQKSAPVEFSSVGLSDLNLVAEPTTTLAESGTSDSMLGDHAFVRFRVGEDISNTQIIQNISEPNQKGEFQT